MPKQQPAKATAARATRKGRLLRSRKRGPSVAGKQQKASKPRRAAGEFDDSAPHGGVDPDAVLVPSAAVAPAVPVAATLDDAALRALLPPFRPLGADPMHRTADGGAVVVAMEGSRLDNGAAVVGGNPDADVTVYSQERYLANVACALFGDGCAVYILIPPTALRKFAATQAGGGGKKAAGAALADVLPRFVAARGAALAWHAKRVRAEACDAATAAQTTMRGVKKRTKHSASQTHRARPKARPGAGKKTEKAVTPSSAVKATRRAARR